jgi:hypothetical protein
MKIIDKYYQVSDVIDDDIEVLSLVLKIMKLKSDTKILHKLETLKLDEFASEFNVLYNEISNKSLKEFAVMLRSCINNTKPPRKKYTYKKVIQRKKKLNENYKQGRLF